MTPVKKKCRVRSIGAAMATLIQDYRLLNSGIPRCVTFGGKAFVVYLLSLLHISEPTRQEAISYALFSLKKKI